eukprot:6492579-Amphidinium_carterae.1
MHGTEYGELFMDDMVQSENMVRNDDMVQGENMVRNNDVVSGESMVRSDDMLLDENIVQGDMDEDFGYDVEVGPARMKPKPKEPSLKERELHEAMGHVPYRSWCPACIAGHARSDPHRRKPQESDIFAFDYGYMERQADLSGEEESASPILIGRDSRSSWTSAELVPTKGAGHPWPLESLLTVVRGLGYPRIILRTDGEPAILDLRSQLAAQLRVRHGIESVEELAEDSQANGLAEGAVRDMKAGIRTLYYAVQQAYGPISPRHPVLAFLVRHAAMCYNLGRLGRDGSTPWQRLKGRQFGNSLTPFAEIVMWHCGGPSRYDGRWQHGMYLGISDKNGQYLVGVEGKVVLARTIRRLTGTERVDRVRLDQIAGRPWQLDPTGVPLEPGVILGEVPPAELPNPEPGMQVRKRVYIRRDQELLEHGFTEGCLGCESARFGLPPRPHTEGGCRLRIEQAMAATERGRQRLAEAAARGAGSSSMVDTPDAAASGSGKKRSREEDAAERDVRAKLAAALSRIGCGAVHSCIGRDVRAADMCLRILDLRGL